MAVFTYTESGVSKKLIYLFERSKNFTACIGTDRFAAKGERNAYAGTI